MQKCSRCETINGDSLEKCFICGYSLAVEKAKRITPPVFPVNKDKNNNNNNSNIIRSTDKPQKKETAERPASYVTPDTIETVRPAETTLTTKTEKKSGKAARIIAPIVSSAAAVLIIVSSLIYFNHKDDDSSGSISYYDKTTAATTDVTTEVTKAETTKAVSDRKQKAVERAESYLNSLDFSYKGLIEQLEYEGFTHEEAVYGADNCDADWMQEALDAAVYYTGETDFRGYSYLGLIDWLETIDSFTHEQAVYGADNCKADWMQEALEAAVYCTKDTDTTGYSYLGLIEWLESCEDFTHEQAVYGTDNCGADWMQEAVKSAGSYIDSLDFSYKGLIEQLEYEQFTHEQAVYGVDNCKADWKQEAVDCAKNCLKYSPSCSRQDLYERLMLEKFTPEQAEYALKAVGF